jgi:AraC-like DNA-binding protein
MNAHLRVLTHESELGSWELVLRTPHPALAALVSDYQGYVERGSPAPLRQQAPTTWLPLIVNFGAPWDIAESEDGPPTTRASFLAGLGEHSSYVRATGPANCMQVNLTPLAAHMFLGLPMHELANHVVTLEDVLPRNARLLTDRLEDAGSWEARFALLDAVFAERLAQARQPSDDVAWAWRSLERTHGKAPIGWICDRLGRSRRHLASRFREQIGLTPKTVARIFRFERAVALLQRGDVSLAELAFECGYYDQAHLNRDFRDFAGRSPAAYARRIVPDGGVIL